jgi:hypothetical protein
METALIIVGFIVLCGVGIAWDYYKPSRFRTGYHNVKKNSGGITGDSGSDDSCGDGGD